jgi:hypothetical protein
MGAYFGIGGKYGIDIGVALCYGYGVDRVMSLYTKRLR